MRPEIRVSDTGKFLYVSENQHVCTRIDTNSDIMQNYNTIDISAWTKVGEGGEGSTYTNPDFERCSLLQS